MKSLYADGVVVNPHCPPELLAEYCEPGWDSWMQSQAAQHPATPTASLLTVIASNKGAVATAARRNIARRDHSAILRAMLLTQSRGRRQIAALVGCSVQRLLSQDPDPRIRYAIAIVATDADLLTQLSRDRHARVRRAASDRVLDRLAS